MGRDGVLRKFTLTSLELTQAVYPRAHTCFNRIDVPLYRTKEELVAGFEFVLELARRSNLHDGLSILMASLVAVARGRGSLFIQSSLYTH